MNSFQRLLKAMATCLHWFGVVRGGGPFPPESVERRGWRTAKNQMFDAFDLYWSKVNADMNELGGEWVRIVDSTAINYGRFNLYSQEFEIVRFGPNDLLFFPTMTDLLLFAAWTNS